MREIKFRGIPLFGNEFVFGSLIIEKNEKGEDTYTIRRYENGKVSYFEVKPESVGQYTDLKDKNNIEIYEGDKVKDHFGRIMLIQWAKGEKYDRNHFARFEFKLLSFEKKWTDNFRYAEFNSWYHHDKKYLDVEIIKNKELLEQEK
ncbi:YopX family protein [Aliarcobacter butzleri]|uniref:YopX family protein n=1 Tax=Aliarcobacter butzleri TaxID=28197 RepID=UPI00263D0C3A|nr:YopX family protein [Aliarcobacter butzleri]MDN5053814.1 YopX family protein [Aliarcobacter butzleri]